jgi:hypothetical protein
MLEKPLSGCIDSDRGMGIRKHEKFMQVDWRPFTSDHFGSSALGKG